MPHDPGPRPEPTAEEPPLKPGGADAITQDEDAKYGDTPGDPTTRDLPPEANPAVDDALPEETHEPDDKQQEGDTSGPDDTGDGDRESP